LVNAELIWLDLQCKHFAIASVSAQTLEFDSLRLLCFGGEQQQSESSSASNVNRVAVC
jgi:hypothetical protein